MYVRVHVCECACVCMHVHVVVCVVLQVYRLEPLINEAYASIKPVKVDNASSRPSKASLDHVEGPKTDQTLAAQSEQSGSWMSSPIGGVSKEQVPESKEDNDKVRGVTQVSDMCVCVCVCVCVSVCVCVYTACGGRR